jgi:hypothetical protein
MGDCLFELASASLKRANASDRFILLREDADPDVMWNIEVYRSGGSRPTSTRRFSHFSAPPDSRLSECTTCASSRAQDPLDNAANKRVIYLLA